MVTGYSKFLLFQYVGRMYLSIINSFECLSVGLDALHTSRQTSGEQNDSTGFPQTEETLKLTLLMVDGPSMSTGVGKHGTLFVQTALTKQEYLVIMRRKFTISTECITT